MKAPKMGGRGGHIQQNILTNYSTFTQALKEIV